MCDLNNAFNLKVTMLLTVRASIYILRVCTLCERELRRGGMNPYPFQQFQTFSCFVKRKFFSEKCILLRSSHCVHVRRVVSYHVLF